MDIETDIVQRLRQRPTFLMYMECANEIERLRVEIHDQAAEIAGNHAMLKFKDEQLATVTAERDELKQWLEDQVCEAKDFAYKLESKTVELATVTKQRDELVEALDEIRRTHYPAGVLAIADATLAKLGADKEE